MANTINFALAQMPAQPSDGEALYNFLQALFDSMMLHVVVSSTTVAQPGSPTEEQAYILAGAGSATGTNWAGNDDKVAVYINGTWYFFAPKDGWTFWDQANQEFVRYDLATTTWVRVAVLQAHTKSLSILNPNTGENLTFCYFKRASTIRRVNAVIRGGTSILIQLVQGTDRSAAGTNVFSGNQTVNSTTTGNEFTTFSDATMPAGSWLWLTTSTETGVVNELHVTVEYTEDG